MMWMQVLQDICDAEQMDANFSEVLFKKYWKINK